MDVEELTLAGPAGALQARMDAPDTITAVAVLCHPHPQYGGNMHDAVLDAAASALLASGHACLRFNFRGVGASSGTFDDGRGETDDALAAVAGARDRHPDRPLLLAGYSFGARVAWAAAHGAQPERLLLIAPPVGMMDFDGRAPAGTAVKVIVGDEDPFAPAEAVQRWAEALDEEVDLSIIADADHFFHGFGRDLTAAVARTTT